MNYYEHHLGDYDGATAHLSWLEDCAYRRLICLCYRSEEPLPADVKQVCRLARTTSKPERDAVQQVLREFFELRDDGWHNIRCDEDIASFHDAEPERIAKKENAKERQRRARERRRQLFAELRSHDIVPAWDTQTKQLETLLSQATSRTHNGAGHKPVTSPVTLPVTPDVAQPVTCDNTATHLPLPNTQSKEEIQGAAAAPPPVDVWSFGVSVFVGKGMSEDTSRRLIGRWLKDWDEETVADALTASADKADPKGYAMAVLKARPKRDEMTAGVEFKHGQATIGGFVA
jgi:uncharacterized protein YdaU (DUF1376 family)